MGREKKRRIAANGRWLPVPLDFLRSRACAELSPLSAKLLLDLLALLGPNCSGNGDLSISPKALAARGWSSRASLQEAVRELLDHGLLVITRQGSRTECRLFAVSLFPLDCDQSKLDVGRGCYTHFEHTRGDPRLATPPSESDPARWRRARKSK